MKNTFSRPYGFSLVELMVVLVLTFVVSIMIYKSYQTFSLTTDTQEQYLELNQNLRIGLDSMVGELRMAGYKDADPKRRPPGGTGFVLATANTVRFTLDYTGGGDDGFDNDKDGQVDEADENPAVFPYSDGKVGATMSDPLPANGEDVTFALSATADTNGSFRLQRTDNTSAAGAQTLVENVDGLNFVYYDSAGAALPFPISGTALDNIRSVEVTMVVRSTDIDPDINDSNTYNNSQGTLVYKAPAANNQRKYRHRLLTARVRCRNMGL